MGGTIDKAYPKATGAYAFDISAPASRDILEVLNPSFTYDIVSICKKDSQDIVNDDITNLIKYLQKSPHNHIVITHGTDTMAKTGKALDTLRIDKTIILTGASKPAAFKNSDAACQVGTAIVASQLLPAGVYIAMHGIVKKVAEISRDPQTGKFK